MKQGAPVRSAGESSASGGAPPIGSSFDQRPDPSAQPLLSGPAAQRPTSFRSSRSSTSWRSLRAKRSAGLAVALGLLGVVAMLSIAVGANRLPLVTVWQVLWDDDRSEAAVIVHDLRVPRTLVGLLVGAALGVAGALTQALTRNALADPGLLGVNLGASAAVVVAISFLGVSGPAGYVWFAMAGAAVASVTVYLLGSTGHSAARPERLVVAGAAVSAVLGAFIFAVMFLDHATFDRFRHWDVGSLAAGGSTQLTQVAPFVGTGLVLAIGLARPLNALATGEDSGRGLGVGIGRTRTVGVVAVALLCGSAAAGAGPIAFVGLVVPHAARMVAGPDQRWVTAYSLVLAPVLLLGADVVGRVVIAPAELEVGIVTAFVGAPVFVVLCRRRRLARL